MYVISQGTEEVVEYDLSALQIIKRDEEHGITVYQLEPLDFSGYKYECLNKKCGRLTTPTEFELNLAAKWRKLPYKECPHCRSKRGMRQIYYGST